MYLATFNWQCRRVLVKHLNKSVSGAYSNWCNSGFVLQKASLVYVSNVELQSKSFLECFPHSSGSSLHPTILEGALKMKEKLLCDIFAISWRLLYTGVSCYIFLYCQKGCDIQCIFQMPRVRRHRRKMVKCHISSVVCRTMSSQHCM